MLHDQATISLKFRPGKFTKVITDKYLKDELH